VDREFVIEAMKNIFSIRKMYSLAWLADGSPFQSLSSIRSGRSYLPAWVSPRNETLMEGQPCKLSSYRRRFP